MNLHAYLGKSPKRALQYQELADELKLESFSILRNVKTRWISVYKLGRRVWDMYKSSLITMAHRFKRKLLKKGFFYSKLAKKNHELLVDLQTFLSIPCILPLLRSMHLMIQFAQGRNVFINDYLSAVNMCIMELESWYVDPATRYSVHYSWDHLVFLRWIP
jgi:hypothetical protein